MGLVSSPLPDPVESVLPDSPAGKHSADPESRHRDSAVSDTDRTRDSPGHSSLARAERLADAERTRAALEWQRRDSEVERAVQARREERRSPALGAAHRNAAAAYERAAQTHVRAAELHETAAALQDEHAAHLRERNALPPREHEPGERGCGGETTGGGGGGGGGWERGGSHVSARPDPGAEVTARRHGWRGSPGIDTP